MSRFIGGRFWDDRAKFHVQTDNPTEQAMRIYGKNGWLVSCGPTAMVNCLNSIGYSTDIPPVGTYKPQPEEIAFDFINDPRVLPELMAIRRLDFGALGIGAQEVPQYYPHVAASLFKANGRYWDNLTIERIVETLLAGGAVQVSTIGHYIAIVAVDVDQEIFVYNDSWPGGSPGDGFNEWLTFEQFAKKRRPWGITYSPQSSWRT